MPSFKSLGRWLAPTADKEEDGRDKWPSRTAFVLAAMGGAVGLGNLLRYPSVVFANNGVQWFIPYLIALLFLGIPVLILEIAIGQAYRGGVAVAFHGISKRTKGVGLGVVLTGYVVSTYYVPILAFVMHYFRGSFQSPLPWTGRGDDYYKWDVVANPDPIKGTIENGKVTSYVQYPSTGMVGETVGWCAFMWVLIYLCIFKGVGSTGRAVYITMGLPIVMIFILMGRSLSLPNAIKGVRMYFAEWHGEKLAGGQIWQGACGQIFFSIGVGFGYFTSYASYNTKYANAVQDAFIIGFSNSLYEVLAGFAVFGIVGFLDLKPDETTLSTFTVGFLTYPLALAEMPGANVWAVLFFLTLALLGLSSAFALTEGMVTLLYDTPLKKLPRPAVTGGVVLISFLLSLMYCTEFGFYLLDAVDTWTNNLSLIFVVWCEGVAITTIYRYKDVCGQVGVLAYGINTATYLLSMILGVAVGQSVSAEAGAGVGFGIFIVGTIAAGLLAKNPDSRPPSFWGNNNFTSRLWWLMLYSCNQLRRDLNNVIATGKNWKIPVVWGPIIKYISCPILSIIVSFAYPQFYQKRDDPLHIFSFAVAHVVMILIAIGFIMPRAFDVFIPPEKMYLADMPYAPQEIILGVLEESDAIEAREAPHDASSDDAREGPAGKEK